MVLGMIAVYLIFKLILLALAIGIGFLLHWILPGVDLGMCILLGLMASGISIYFFAGVIERLLLELHPYDYDDDDDDDEEELYEEELYEEETKPRLKLQKRISSIPSKKRKKRRKR